MTMAQHREAIEAAIQAVWTVDDKSPLHVYEYVQSVQQVPAVVIIPANEPTITPNSAFGRGSATYNYDLICLAPRTELVSNQMTLDELVDPKVEKSIPWIISTTRVAPPIMAWAWLRVDNYGANWSSANVEHIGALVRIEIQTC